METIVPMKYLKTDWGLIALVSRLDENGNERDVYLTPEVRADLHEEGVMGIVTGNVLLPIPERLLEFVIANPVIQVSLLTENLIDEEHVIVNLDLPSLYELRGLWKASQRGAGS